HCRSSGRRRRSLCNSHARKDDATQCQDRCHRQNSHQPPQGCLPSRTFSNPPGLGTRTLAGPGQQRRTGAVRPFGTLGTVPKAFLIVSILSALASLNAIRPIRFPLVMVPSFVSAWLTVELAQFRLLVQLVATAAFVAAGALRETPGRIGLVVMAASIAGTVYLLVIANRSGEVMERALREALGDDYRNRIDPDLMAGRDPGLRWQQVLRPFRMRHPKVERVRDIT